MKAAEKELIYDLLKKASGAATGYTSANFSGEYPAFTDDAEIVQQPIGVQDGVPQQQGFDGGTSVPFMHPASPNGQEALNIGASFEGAFQNTVGNSIEEIAQKVAACNACVLAQTRKNVVPGEGVPQPAVLVIGEGPGAEEDNQGRPFVGKAGQLLDKMLAAINLYRTKNCFIANIVKCRPPMNRDPAPDECLACSQFIQSQIQVLKPKMILAVGRIALQKLLDTSVGITKMHGQFLDYKGIPFMATFHPSALLRDETLKRPAWEDLKKFKARLLELCPEYDK